MMLGELLSKTGAIRPDQLQIALVEQQLSGEKLGRVLLNLGFVSAAILRQSLAKMAGVPSVDLARVAPDPEALECIPRELAERFQLVPVRYRQAKNTLVIAMSDPRDLVALDHIRRLRSDDTKLKVVLAIESDIEAAWDAFYGHERRLDTLLTQLDSEESRSAATEVTNNGAGAQLVISILRDAVSMQCSDIHLEPESGFVRIRYRVDGVLTPRPSLHEKHWPAMLGRLKVLAGLDLAETRAPQDGGFSETIAGKRIDFRVSSFPVLHGENLVMRVLDRNKQILSLDHLQQPEDTITAITTSLQQPEGVILVAGPTGSGKTSTIYSMIKTLNTPAVNIMTLEDPVEYPLDLVRQSSIGQQNRLGFSAGIRAIMRQDPDIVVIGEIRDADTARIAMRAAMTGHKVLSTVHARSSLSAVQRLMDLGVDAATLAANVSAVVAQRLVRLRCAQCRGKDATTCEACAGSGYRGRRAVMETLIVDKDLSQSLIQQQSTVGWRDKAAARGWKPMAELAQALVRSGDTDASEVHRVFGTVGERV
ncbi:MAG TPA: secretion system protein E [Gammaproteobacteria bacterium]|jgi:general secretion pathway protein E/type IV pilus assembly protein PilB|nr:secretion system protein E [Gammaproteobacteria bacterium]